MLTFSLWLSGCAAKHDAKQEVGGQTSALKSAPAAMSTPRPQGAAPAAALPAPDPNVVWVMMKDQADLSTARSIPEWGARGAAVRDALMTTAMTRQGPIQSFLAQRSATFEQFWIVNALKVRADADTVKELKSRPDVALVEPDRVYALPPLQRVNDVPRVNGIEWGIVNVRASEAWDTFGSLGEDIIVANLDSGVQFDHSALVRQYRGNQAGAFDHNYNWFDPSAVCGNPSLVPCDNAGHGTHTMGTMVGADESGENQIGVAPGARWIAAKGCESNSCSEAALLASAQWLLAPTDLNGENPRPELRPNIVNNSWGGAPGDTFFQAAVQAWVAAGIFPVFSAGNSGPACGSTGSPGDYPESYAVAAYDENNTIAPFSSRGPGALGAGKPNIAGPGVAVRSSVPGNGYDSYSGTSMAAPHVAGTIALLWSAAPALVGDIEGTRALLDAAAVDTSDSSCGGDDDNNYTWGEGRLDSYTTLEMAPRGPTGSLVGTVTAAGAAVANAKITARAEEVRDRMTTTDEAGAYKLRLAVGTYEVEARAFGYFTQKVPGVAISEDAETTQDFSLEPAPTFAISGTVTDTDGNTVPGAKVSLVGTPLDPIMTDAAGHYVLEAVPQGEYELLVDGGNCYEKQTYPVNVAGPLTQDATLPKRYDTYGYSCTPVAQTYVTATKEIIATGDEQSVAVELPFTFVYYGKAYTKAFVSVNGTVHFMQGQVSGFNSPIPSTFTPNAAIYALWDDLHLDDSSSILTEVVGEAPNRKLVVEWRDVLAYEDPGARYSFEVLLGEAGDITLQYAARDTSAPIGKLATIGIENATGDDGLQFSYNQDSLVTGASLRYALPPSGLVQGTVTDANDGLAIVGAIVTAQSGDVIARKTKTDAQGAYLLQVPVGEYTIAVAPERYVPAQKSASVGDNTTSEVSFVLETGAVEVEPPVLELVIPQGESRTRTLALSNVGTAPLAWSLTEAGGQKQNLSHAAATAGTASASTDVIVAGASTGTQAQMLVTSGRLASIVGFEPQSAGDIISSFQPSGVSQAWGVGFDGNVWVSDASQLADVEFTPEGTPTGRSWSTPWAGFFPGDMAYDPINGLMCQMNVGGDSNIYCWNQATGEVVSTIPSNAWSGSPQMGLAYNPSDDSFYVGGWFDGVIYHVQGASHPNPGELISQCTPSDPNASGLAWNGSMGVLWMATNSPTDTIFELNPEDCTVLSTLAHPNPGFNGGGLEIDELGNLWMVSQSQNTVYLMESGVPSFSDVSWLSVTPEAGTLAAGASEELTVSIDTAGLEPGLYLASLFAISDAGRTPALRIPISLVVTSYQRAVDAGSGSDYSDSTAEVWSADRKYSEGDWGYVNDSLTWKSSHDIAGTPDPALYQTVRINPFGYRFDGVPNGVYQVELKFAQLLDLDPGQRQFDVIVEDTLVLPAYDPAYRSGAYHADDHTFFVPVTDGVLDVRFATRIGLPIISALRVTHRPDR